MKVQVTFKGRSTGAAGNDMQITKDTTFTYVYSCDHIEREGESVFLCSRIVGVIASFYRPVSVVIIDPEQKT